MMGSLTNAGASVPMFFNALPAYFGGKRRLCPLIFALLAEFLPRERWADSAFLDPFCGAGAVALYAKVPGFHVTASDLAERGAVTARALIANSSVRLREADVLDLFQPTEADVPHVAAAHVPGVFNAHQAKWLDNAFARASQRPEPMRSLLLLFLIKVTLRLQPMSMLRGTDARAAAEGDYDRVSPRRLGHYLRASRHLTPGGAWCIAEEVNLGVFGGRGEAFREDALTAIATHPNQVLYLDPPYPKTAAYEHEYAVLDLLLGDSPPSGTAPTLDDLLDAGRESALVVLSYGGPTVTLDQLTATVSAHRRVLRALAIPYRHLGSIASEEKNAQNREYLVVAGR
jgi:D12 class N6 adenine-specific DNA methyltransferase